jgi:hypothetical protein
VTKSADDELIQAWTSLPRRIYLDTSTLQTVFENGEAIWDGGTFEPVGRATRVEGLAEEVDALWMIFQINQRASFQFVVTEPSLREVVVRDRGRYTQWVYDVLDTWLVQSGGEEPPMHGTMFEDRRFGMISVNDRRLLQDALDWPCDAFMTMERRLPTAAEFIERETGLRVMRPTTCCNAAKLSSRVAFGWLFRDATPR